MEREPSIIWGDWERKGKQEFEGKYIYCKYHKIGKDECADFVVTENQERVGIEGSVGAFSGKKPDIVTIDFGEISFADFYTEEGQLIKKMVYDKKYYLFDGMGYYEVTSDSKLPDEKSHETFVGKEEKHKYLREVVINYKEKLSKVFLEMFEAIR